MNKRIAGLIVALLLQCCSTGLWAQPARVSVRTDAQQIMIGDQLRYFIEATADTSARLQWAVLPDTFNTLELVEKGKIDTIRQGASVTYKQRLLITGFDSGSFTIPRLVFYTKNAGAVVDSVKTDSFRVLVQTVAVDTTKAFKGIKGIAEVTVTWKDYIMYIIIAVLLLAAVVALTVFLVKRKKPAVEPAAPVIVETDQERALRLLDELSQKHLWEQDRIKEYYTELTDIVRLYIEARFQTPAMELTTDELLKKAKKNRDMIPYVKSLRSLLDTADLAKFAKANPTAQEHIEAIDMAKEFILISTPKTVTATPSHKPKNA